MIQLYGQEKPVTTFQMKISLPTAKNRLQTYFLGGSGGIRSARFCARRHALVGGNAPPARFLPLRSLLFESLRFYIER